GGGGGAGVRGGGGEGGARGGGTPRSRAFAAGLVPLPRPAMADVRPRVPIKAGYFTIPDDPAAPPEVLCTRCEDCGEYFFPQRLVCAKCLSRRTVEAKVPARGTPYAYPFVHRPLVGS